MKDIRFRQLSTEKMNEVILDKVPLEERLKAVYIPIVAMDCTCYLADDLLKILKTLKMDSTKKASRTIKSCIEGYRSENIEVMHSDLYRHLSGKTKDFYDSIANNMVIYQLQYRQAMLDARISLSTDKVLLVATSYVVRELAKFVIELDRGFSNAINARLGGRISYCTEDNKHCIGIISSVDSILEALAVPDCLRSDSIDMAFTIVKNKIKALNIWSCK